MDKKSYPQDLKAIINFTKIIESENIINYSIVNDMGRQPMENPFVEGEERKFVFVANDEESKQQVEFAEENQLYKRKNEYMKNYYCNRNSEDLAILNWHNNDEMGLASPATNQIIADFQVFIRIF